jgi:1,4-dihydroxy-2-naphthoate octaprenyltransferase
VDPNTIFLPQRVELLQSLLGCCFACAVIWYAYRGGPVRYGTIPMPRAGRIIIFVCGAAIFVYSLKRLIVFLMR